MSGFSTPVGPTLGRRKTCRACDGADLVSVLDLGNQPLANRFVSEGQLEWQEPDYPLHMVRCTACGLCQLTHVVDPEVLYRDYAYESGHSPGWHDHCRGLAAEIAARYAKGSVLDIAANDGTLLGHCAVRGLRVLGVDPAGNINAGNVPVVKTFWPTDLGQQFDVIVAQNVFGHVDDARGFLQGIARALQRDGLAIIECPSLYQMIWHGRWDTIYHEHLSYWNAGALIELAADEGLAVTQVIGFPDLHGGTNRYYLRHNGVLAGDGVRRLTEEHFGQFAIRAYGDIKRWNAYLQNPQGRGLGAYGASAKLNTFLNALPDRPKIVGIFDDNPRKHRLYTPGWHIPVLRPAETVMLACDELLIGAPNWRTEILAKAESLGFKGEVTSLWRQ